MGLQGAGRGHGQEQVGRCVRRVYFDITDIIQFAGRNTRLTGIQRVVFNIVNLLSRKYGSDRMEPTSDVPNNSCFKVDASHMRIPPQVASKPTEQRLAARR